MSSPDAGWARRVKDCVDRAYQHAAEEDGAGEVARYIPELARVDPELLAVAVCTVDGEVWSTGDDRHELTLQSLSKPFVYGWALERFGLEAVHERVGVDPTGDAFDSIIRLDAAGRAHNPMINAGAITVTGMFAGSGGGSARLEELLAKLGSFAGRELTGVDVPVYLSERTAGHRNRAIAHLLHHLGALKAPVKEALDLYFQQCSVLVTCRDLAVMAATLAHGGRCPLGGDRVLPEALVRYVLAVMFTSGLYDFSGGFAVEVGLPAKSGVCGGVLAVVPGCLGMAAFSPRLDERGNSLRGMRALRHLAEGLELHCFRSRSPIVSASSASVEPRPPLDEVLRETLTEARDVDGGAVAEYLPSLASVSPELFGLAVTTVDGEDAAAGDSDTPWTLQAVANPFGYALALEHSGFEAVHRHVGVEPSDNPFNAIRFDPRTSRPYNPLSNAGAMTVAALQPGGDATDRLNRLLSGFAGIAGEERVVLDAGVFLAEQQAGERNRAIASLLRNFGHVDDEESALELYLQQCSIRATCRRLARMGATLAHGGVEPRSGRRVLSADTVRRVLSLMYTCGLHDETGRFAFEVGLAAKTGISGGIVAVVPGRMGIAVYSPRVNEHGSSVRGLAALKALSDRLSLNVFAP